MVTVPDLGSAAPEPFSAARTGDRETVSVVVTAWHRQKFLAEAIASVQFTAGSPFELVVAADFRDDDLEREFVD